MGIEDLQKIIWDLLDEVDLYKRRVYELGYDNSFLEFEFRKGMLNYEKIIKRLEAINLPNIDTLISKTISIDELKNYLTIILNKVFGEKYKEDIKIGNALLTTSKRILQEDGVSTIKDIRGLDTYTSFKIPEKINLQAFCTAANLHFTNISKNLYNNFPNTFTNIHYCKLFPILTEYLSIYYLSEILKNPEIITLYNLIRTSYTKSEIEETISQKASIEFINEAISWRKKDFEEFNEHEIYSYVIGDIYANRLFEYFLEDKEKLIKHYQSFICEEESIKDILKYYNIDLKNKDVTLSYINKLDKIEQRYN